MFAGVARRVLVLVRVLGSAPGVLASVSVQVVARVAFRVLVLAGVLVVAFAVRTALRGARRGLEDFQSGLAAASSARKSCLVSALPGVRSRHRMSARE